MRSTIFTDGITVEVDGDEDFTDAVQRDAFEVQITPPSGEEAKRAARILVDWSRRVLERKAG